MEIKQKYMQGVRDLNTSSTSKGLLPCAGVVHSQWKTHRTRERTAADKLLGRAFTCIPRALNHQPRGKETDMYRNDRSDPRRTREMTATD